MGNDVQIPATQALEVPVGRQAEFSLGTETSRMPANCPASELILLWVQLPPCFWRTLETVWIMPGWSSAMMVNTIEVFMSGFSIFAEFEDSYDIGNAAGFLIGLYIKKPRQQGRGLINA